jgi:hypothetical protein
MPMRQIMLRGKDRDRLRAIIAAVNKLPASFPNIGEQTAECVHIFEFCGGDVWRAFDEDSWSDCKERFHLVRQVRNNPTAAGLLFDAINRQPVKRKRKALDSYAKAVTGIDQRAARKLDQGLRKSQ